MFFGTSGFAEPILRKLEAGGRTPNVVVSQPDRPAGRKREMKRPPAARWASEGGLELIQPEKASDPSLLERLRGLQPEWGVVADYGQILRAELLAIPRRGFVNVHGSLLPAYRGAAPIQAAVAAGEQETGVTIMQVDEGLDTGPIVLQRKTPIGPHETAPELFQRLAELGGALLLEALEGLERGELQPHPQDEERATWAPRLKRADGDLTWELPASVVYDRWRAYQPWPGVRAPVGEERVKLDALHPVSDAPSGPPGRLLDLGEDSVTVACGEGSALEIGTLQRPGLRLLPAPDVVRDRKSVV